MAKSETSSVEFEKLDLLAAEYVLGVGDAAARAEFEKLCAGNEDIRAAKLRWETRLQELNADYTAILPPAHIKQKIDAKLFSPAGLAPVSGAVTGKFWNALGFWRALGLAGSAAAIGFGIYTVRLNDVLSDAQSQLAALGLEKTSVEETLQTFEAELASRNKQLSGLETKLAEGEAKLTKADVRLAGVKAELDEAVNIQKPILVVSLQSGETDYRFLAVHELGSANVRMTLVSGALDPSKDFQLWLVEPEKAPLSLGVISSGKSAVELPYASAQILSSGALLAVSVEQKGGSDTGAPQGPVVAVGKPQTL